MRQIPIITKNLIIINVMCFLVMTLMSNHIDINNIFGLHYWQATEFHLYQCVTYMFMHGGFTHIFFNMFTLWMFGGIVERTFGQNRFLIYYFVCGLGGALCQELSQTAYFYSIISGQGGTFTDLLNIGMGDRMALNAFNMVGASGSVYGILLAFAMSYPEEKMFVFPLPVPVKAKWMVLAFALIEIMFAMSNARGALDGVAHVAHLGGMLFGYILIKMWRKTSYSFNGWDGYEIKESSSRGSSPTILGKIRKWLHLDDANDDANFSNNESYHTTTTESNKHNADWEYNATKKKEETEIDIILDKIRRSGYASLTEEEKKKLFDQSKFKKI